MDIEREINSETVIVGDFDTPLKSMDRSSRQKINKETTALNDTLDLMDLIDIFILLNYFLFLIQGHVYFRERGRGWGRERDTSM